MSLKIVLLISAGAGLLGILIGYYLRLIISLGKRGSMELEIKQMMIVAKEEANKITDQANKKATLQTEQLKLEEKRRSRS